MSDSLPGADVILGMALGYGWEQLALFVTSLRAHNRMARVTLVTGSIDSTLKRRLAEYDIETIPAYAAPAWLPKRLDRQRFERRRWAWLRRSIAPICAALPVSAAAKTHTVARLAAPFMYPSCSRYLYYYRWLQPRMHGIGRVLLTDVRDVVFQSDPFPRELGCGLVVLEHESVLGRCPCNDGWMNLVFGPDISAQMRGCRVTCSGTILGPAAVITDYLARMTWTLSMRLDRVFARDGVDQAVHNWLFWTAQLPQFRAVPNFEGPVLTMNGMTADQLRFDVDGHIVDPTGLPVPVLHQFDRIPDIASRILSVIRGVNVP